MAFSSGFILRKNMFRLRLVKEVTGRETNNKKCNSQPLGGRDKKTWGVKEPFFFLFSPLLNGWHSAFFVVGFSHVHFSDET